MNKALSLLGAFGRMRRQHRGQSAMWVDVLELAGPALLVLLFVLLLEVV